MAIKMRNRVKSSCGCVFCDLNLDRDGPQGHLIQGRWIECNMQAKPAARTVQEEASVITLADNRARPFERRTRASPRRLDREIAR